MPSRLIILSQAIVAAALLTTCSQQAQGATEAGDIKLAMDTVWLVTAAALVFFMQAGFALLESGMSRAKNAVNVIMKNYTDVCFGSIIFWLVGYGIMFGANPSGWWGVDHFFLHGAGDLDYSLLFFQTMFAATAATIASGAMAERTRYWGYIIGALVITGFIYPVYGSWAWGSLYGGEGWLKSLGFIDFAGSTVVHSIGGWCALAGIVVLGPRLGRFDRNGTPRSINGHNLTSVGLGGFILWVGWFGFNGGSTAAADSSIGLINLNTHLSAAAGACGALVTMAALRQPMLMTTAINGSIGGLVAITAGCATMEPAFAVTTGLVAGPVVVLGARLITRLGVDDVVDAVAVHGLCGAWGTLAAGMFVTGNLFDLHQISVQALGIAAAFLWSFPLALAVYFIVDRSIGLRVSTSHEQRGLDFSEHYEVGYPDFHQDIVHQGKG